MVATVLGALVHELQNIHGGSLLILHQAPVHVEDPWPTHLFPFASLHSRLEARYGTMRGDG